MSGIKDAMLGDDLFSCWPLPGFKENGTSRDAAVAMRSSAAILRERVYAAFKAAGADGLTADQAAAKIDESPFATRPRVTELGKETPPRIVKTKMRRRNASGLSAAVWIAS